MADKIDSNLTGLAFAEEASLRTLPGTPIWHRQEPNSYSDFGGQISTVARNPINPSRQRKKGVTTDLDASGGYNQDFTLNNTMRILQGFMFASTRQKASTQPLNGAAVALTAIVAANDDYTAAAGLPTSIVSGDLVFGSGFGVAANNGLKLANATSTGTAISVSSSLADEAAPPAAAKVELVGHQFASADLSIVMNGNLVQIASAAFDMSTLPLIPGEWIFLGGDSAGLRFLNNQGFARVSSITADYLECDKVGWTPQAEAGTGLTVQLFYGNVLKNESEPDLIVRRTYQVERSLGEDANGTMSEYLVGAVPNELGLQIQQADKVTMDLSFVAVDNEQRTGTQGLKAGTRPTLVADDAFNTSSDFSRIKLALVDPEDASPVPLFAYATDMSITINNNVTPNKAIGTLGAFDTSAGTFEVSGSLEAYFADVTAVQAVRDNADVTIDMVLAKNNTGVVFDLPLISLGDGRLNVTQDEAIKLPLETNAAESSFGHTLLINHFPYLPDLAM